MKQGQLIRQALAAAALARSRAYVPYSHFKMGSAVAPSAAKLYSALWWRMFPWGSRCALSETLCSQRLGKRSAVPKFSPCPLLKLRVD